MKKSPNVFLMLLVSVLFIQSNLLAQGTWTQIKNAAPHSNNGTMLLLSDGTVLVHTGDGGSSQNGAYWDRLTPDIHGSYINGTWTTTAPMNNDRLYFSSQVLKDGRVYVAGGEYGSGTDYGETYNPLTNTWTTCPNLNVTISDANSEILDNGEVLQGYVGSQTDTYIYNPVTNAYTVGPVSGLNYEESAWVKLPDNSIVFTKGTKSERYIPSQNKWIADGALVATLYDAYAYETGPGLLLPNGNAFFIGSTSNTAIYTPSGSTSPGSWVAGPAIPSNSGAPDAPAAMMVTGNILCAFSPTPSAANNYPSPTSFYEYNYLTNSFTAVSAPGGGTTLNNPTYGYSMLDLPDGTVMFASGNSTKYYIYTPKGSPLAAGKPTIGNIIPNSMCDTFKITGTLFNGISEGAAYGDDEQMNTNYPVIRLTSGTSVYYARSFNWNHTGVQRGSEADTSLFVLPAGLPAGNYWLVVTANGIASDSVSFSSTCSGPTGIAATGNTSNNTMVVYPNPAGEQATVSFNVKDGGNYSISLVDVLGRTIREETGNAVAGNNFHLMRFDGIASGMYIIILQKGDDVFQSKVLIK